jgi:TRAP-type C4-dicarboxylate transport system permease small subunit
MALLGKINTVLLKFASVAVMVSLAAIAIVIPYEVFCRYILNSMNTWSAEFCTYMLVWASMLGGAVGLRKGYHVELRPDGFNSRLEPRGCCRCSSIS